MDGQPEADAEQHVHRDRSHAGPPHQPDDDHDAGGQRQRVEVDVARVEERDHEDRADVVDDGEGEQEQLEGRSDPPAEEAQHADGHRDVGGHRDPPPGRARRRRALMAV